MQASTAGKSAPLKASALDALAMMAFVGPEDPTVLEGIMSHQAGLWKGENTSPFLKITGIHLDRLKDIVI